jgi:hypothetical protein
MPPRRYLALLTLLLLLAIPRAAAAQGAQPIAEAALTPDGLRVTLACPAPAPLTLQVAVDGRPPAVVAPVDVPPAPAALALVVERSPAMAEAGTPYSSRTADAVMLATALLDSAPQGSQASLLTFDDATAQVLVAPAAGLAAVRRALGALVAMPAAQASAGLPVTTAADGRPAARALQHADAVLSAGPAGPRAIVVFSMGALAPGDMPALVSGPRLTFVELGDAGAEAAGASSGDVVGASDVSYLPYYTDDSAALPALFAGFERRSAELLGSDRVALDVPVSGLDPGHHEVRVSGCGAPQVASFEGPAATPGLALWLTAGALAALGLGYDLRRRQRAAGLGAGREPDTARYRSPLELTTARRRTASGEQPELCAVVWDGRERRVHSLQVRQSTVGRDAGCAIQIESEWVSGLHARLSLIGEGVEITDLESTNGTFVGEPGRQLEPGVPAVLGLGEVVRIGPEVRLAVFRAGAEQAEEPL